MHSDLSFPLYVLVKFVAYIAWSYFGLRLFRGQAALRGALGFGFVRLCLGIAFGVGIFFAGGMMHLEVPRHPVLMYLSVYAPVRYVEWSILFALILRRSDAGRTLSGLSAQLWILGGIMVSHLADLPLILLSGEGAKGFLPVGRFLC